MKTAEELQKEFGVTQEQMDKAFGNYTCPKCKAISEQIGLCKACMIPPRPATAQPSAAKSPEEYAKLVGGMATGEIRRTGQVAIATGTVVPATPITDVEQVFPPVDFYRHTFGLSAAAMDRRASDRANDKAPKPVLGKCPRCSYEWLLADRESCLNRKLYAGEELMCSYCLHPVTAIPVNPNQTTPEMTESHWEKIERLEQELEAEREARLKATHLLAAKEQELAEATKTRPEMLAKANHDMGVRIVELERQLRDTQETAKKDDEFRVKLINDSNESLTQAADEMNSFRHRAEKAERDMVELKKDLQAARAEAQESSKVAFLAEEARKRSHSQVVDLQNKLDVAEDKLKSKDTELTEMSEAIDVATAELDNAEKAITRLTTAVSDRDDKIVQELLKTRKEDEEKIKDREESCQEMYHNLESARAVIINNKKDHSARVQALQTKLDAAEEKYQSVVDQNLRISRAVQETEAKIKDREMTMAVKDDKIRALETDNKFLEKRCDEANDYAKNASAKLAEMEEKLEHGIKQEHDLLEKAMHNAREEIRRLCQENETLRVTLNSAEKRVASLREENQKLQEKVFARNFQPNPLTNDLQKARAACARLRQQAEGLQAQLNNAVEDRENVNRRFNQLIKARNEVAEERDRYSNTNQTLQQQRDSMIITLRIIVFIALCTLLGLILAIFQIASPK